MADTLQFDLVSPERLLSSVQATQVELPGASGDMTAMPDHAPLLTSLRPGIVRVHAGAAVTEYFLTGGFAELSGSSLSVLAENAVPRAEVTRGMLDAALVSAEASLADATDETRTLAALQVNDMKTLIEVLGL